MSNENSNNHKETYQMKDINGKNDETTPLTKHENNEIAIDNHKENLSLEEKLSLEKETETNRQSKRKPLTFFTFEEILSNQTARLIVGVCCAMLLILSIIIIACVLIIGTNSDDRTNRFLRIVPKPRGSSNLIYFRHGDLKKHSGTRSWTEMVTEIDEFLAPYRNPSSNTSLCLVNDREQMPKETVCLFDLNTIDRECLKSDYGYMSGRPCIFIVFNNIRDWSPKTAATNQTEPTTNIIDLECTANTQFDAENVGPMDFTPFQGFSSIYFPYEGQPNYQAPFVVLRLQSPTQNVGIGLTCKLLIPKHSNDKTNEEEETEPLSYIPFNIFIE
ncbi:Sodium/potassium-transporting ATPase subunit beta [Sarcoptes scabiei]|uniref:Sodium/potassium-transporting ATPase subunit beta n=2 Tax=Sarcoptes scabiei TaxID=52283 RepID=A0A834VE43_SARSC|nr:Sodium/potassium-transporting ATPase subunit beta [Sarcoptes scabiei]